jgi:hypothetical protein
MDTLTTPVLLRYLLTNSRNASVSIVAGSVENGRQYTESVYAGRSSELVSLWDQSES